MGVGVGVGGCICMRVCGSGWVGVIVWVGVRARVCLWIDARGNACIISYVHICTHAYISFMQKTELRTTFKWKLDGTRSRQIIRYVRQHPVHNNIWLPQDSGGPEADCVLHGAETRRSWGMELRLQTVHHCERGCGEAQTTAVSIMLQQAVGPQQVKHNGWT